ncbi:hypothetical protein A9Q87_05345 [Flavobacteriales bacterium 34_180_T64]|nr:hypothetical protein A9Q87_05345 [Flavobacteriales bacterium 34_180_T64]
MNPSSHGWIEKLLKEVSSNETYLQAPISDFYRALKRCGFIYGSNVDVIYNSVNKGDLSSEELCKVNLMLTFKYVHHNQHCNSDFVDSVINFYKAIEEYKISFLEGLLGEKKSSALLEKIISKRIHIDDNIITKNFNYFIINALLFVDVLAYQKSLLTNSISEEYLKHIEASIETIVIKVFDTKQDKTEYDKSLIKLFEASLRYHNNDTLNYKEIIGHITSPLEKQYIVDIVCMASWSDKSIDKTELDFLNQMQKDLGFETELITTSIDDINTFYHTNKDGIAFLNSKNLVQSFYDNSSQIVSKLISRNSKRLNKELKQSKELMILLTQSTTRNLSDEEQKQVHDQLIDIIKSIPSLAIFLLPGGALLLPIFIKFIPKLLPSAFDDNRLDE